MNLLTSQDPNEKFPVDARKLHHELESKRQFGNWITTKIKSGGFVEDEDFIVFNKFVENPKGGRPAIDYNLSTNMAKHLCQMEGTEKGKQCRNYFIKSEEALQEVKKNPGALMNQGVVEEFAKRVKAAMKLDTLQTYKDVIGLPKSVNEYLKEGKTEYVTPFFRKPKKNSTGISRRSADKIEAINKVEHELKAVEMIQPALFDNLI